MSRGASCTAARHRAGAGCYRHPAWPAQEGGRPAPVRGRELATGTRPGASYGSERGSSGSAVRPGG